MENLLTGPINALNEVLKKWAGLGGRDAMLAGFKNAWEALGKILGPIKEAFRDIFPATSAENLVKMTNAFRDFTAKLIPSQKTMDGIKRTFAGLFAVLDIGKQLIGAVIHFIVDLVGHFSKGSGGILDFTAKIGDFLVHLDQAIKKGDIFGKFFDWLEPKIEKPVDALKHFVAIIGQMVKAVTGSQTMAAILDRIHKNSGQVADAGGKIASAWEKVKQVFSAIWQAVQPILSKIGDGVKNVVKDIAKALSGISFGDLLGAAGVGAFVALAMKIRSTIDKIFNRKKDKGPGFFDTIKETLEQLTGTLKSMQDALKVGMILAIAAAILALTFAVSILSKIDAVGLAKGVTAITFLITEVTGSMIVLSKMMDKKAKAIKFDLIAAGMILIATAIDILASAVKKLADLSWEQLAKGMSAVTLLLGEVILALNFMPNEGKMISSGAGIILIAAAIKVLVSAVTDMAALSWGDIAKGLSGVAALLLALGLYTKFSDMSSIGDGAGLVLMAASIKILVSAVQDMAGMSWEDIAKGLSGVAGGLIAMSAAIRLMPEDGQTLKNAASVVVIAAALKILASAMKDMSGLSWEDIGKAATSIAGGLGIIILALNGLKFEGNLGQAASLLIVTGAIKVLASAMQDLGGMTWSDIAAGLTALAGGMLIMVVALNSMEGTIPGSLALLAATPGISALASAMANLGGMSWSDIGAGLVALAGGLLILAGGLYLMEGTIPGSLGLLAATPGIYALAGAMKSLGGMTWADIGAGLVALGGALLVLAVGLTAMIITLPGAAALAVAAPALGALASGLASIGGMSWSDIAAGVVALGGSLVALAVGLTAMVASLPGAAALAVAAPALGDLASAMQKIGAMSWSDIAAAAGGITSFLGALAVGSAVSVSILALGGALSVAAPGLEQFVNAVLNSYGIGDNIKAVAAGLMEFSKIPADNLGNIAASADKIAKALPGLNTAVSQGLAPTVASAIQQGADFANNFAKGINDNTGPSTQAGTNLLNKVKDAINGAIPGIAGEVSSNAQSVGKNIVDGVNVGVDNNKGSLTAKMRAMATDALNAAKEALGIHSPSKKFQEIGQFVVEGFALGLTGTTKTDTAVNNLVNDMMGKFNDAMQGDLDDIQTHADKIQNIRDQMQDNAGAIAEAQRKLNEAIADPVAKSKAKKAADRRAADAKAQQAHNDKVIAARIALQKLVDKQNDYNQSINDEQAALNQDGDEYWRLYHAREVLANQLAGQQARLNDLTAQHEDLTQKIKDQTSALDDAIKTRDDYNQSLTDQLDAEAAVNKDTNLNDYVTSFQQQIVDLQQFTIAIQELRKQGLNDTMYKQLLAAGPTEAMPFVQQLLEGGQTAVDNINYLGKTLDDAAGVLGKDASDSLYQAGVDAAAGLLKGLQDQDSNIQAEMQRIADFMVAALNNALGIHSPSRVMAEVGRYSAQGVALGLSESAGIIGQASEQAGQTAIDSMKKTISGLGDLVAEGMDMNPTITPVLDLSGVQKDASSLNDLLGQSLSIGATASSARDALVGYTANQNALAEAIAAQQANSVTFVQNNTSPKALSQAEIYRNTNNQLSRAKGALASNAR
jgi:hypothetical protein